MGSSGLGGKSLGLDSGSEVNACCMLCPGLLDFLMGCCMKSSLSHGYGRHRACLPVACRALWMLADALCLLHTWLWACPTLAHTQEHKSTYTTPPPSYYRACHRECPTLMFVGKSDGC